jgi:hypothetical protein
MSCRPSFQNCSRPGLDRLGRVQLAPARPDRGPVAADDPGHIGQGLGRQRQCSTAEKHQGPWADEGDCGDRFNYQGPHHATRRHAARDQPVPKGPKIRMKKPQCQRVRVALRGATRPGRRGRGARAHPARGPVAGGPAGRAGAPGPIGPGRAADHVLGRQRGVAAARGGTGSWHGGRGLWGRARPSVAGTGPGGTGSPDPGSAGLTHRSGTGAAGDVRVPRVRAGPAGLRADRRWLPRSAKGAAAAPLADCPWRTAGGDHRGVPRQGRRWLSAPGLRCGTLRQSQPVPPAAPGRPGHARRRVPHNTQRGAWSHPAWNSGHARCGTPVTQARSSGHTRRRTATTRPRMTASSPGIGV